MVERLKKAKSHKDIRYQTLKAERNALREHCDGVWNASQKLGEQITTLKAERDMLNTALERIANAPLPKWACDIALRALEEK